jgi:hypothetical protein
MTKWTSAEKFLVFLFHKQTSIIYNKTIEKAELFEQTFFLVKADKILFDKTKLTKKLFGNTVQTVFSKNIIFFVKI